MSAVDGVPRGIAVALAALVAGILLVLAPPARAAVPAWTTYDHDATRSATDPDSGSPVPPTAAWSAPAALDGPIYAQPLVYGSRVYIATENDSVYALDAATGALIWKRSVGTPVPSGNLPCGDISPTVGITSTPVIDPATGRLYAVADELQNGAVHHWLVALTLSSGDLVAGFPVAVDPPGQDPAAILQRSALALDAGRVMIPYGGNAGDCGTYHGWLVSAAEDGSGAPGAFEIDPGSGEHGGAIWGSGDGPMVDGTNLFLSTGNGFGSTTPDLQESVLQLDPSLNLIAHWTPSNWQALDNSDADLGSSDPVLLPGRLLFDIGKDGVGRLLSEDALGTTGQVFSAPACSSGGGFGASLYRAGAIYVPCSEGLIALSLASSGSPAFTADAGFAAPAAASGPPISAGGLIWSTAWRSSGTLYGLDPATGAVRFQTDLGSFDHFATPSAGGGRLFTAAGAQVSALTISSFPPATATALASSANPAPTGHPVTLTATVSPAPDTGSVAFMEGATALPGCASAAVDASTGRATCTVSLAVGTHTLTASFAGDAYFAASRSPALVQVITAPPPGPALSRVRLASRRVRARTGATLRLTLSEAASVTVQLNRLLAGRIVHRRCRAGSRHGRRCSVAHRVRRLRFRGHSGSNRFHLRLKNLPAGPYAAAVTARDAGGRSSRTVTLRFRILAPRR
jgi:outer membrane protein assembly factor BamB